MGRASKVLGLVCAGLTIALWIVTLGFDATPGPIGAATALTAIVAVTFAFSFWHR
jgi:hypothetical protein